HLWFPPQQLLVEEVDQGISALSSSNRAQDSSTRDDLLRHLHRDSRCSCHSTGMLRNLNTMFAAQGDVDPSVYANNWTGFFIFLAAMVVIAAAWIAARPIVLAPLARLFGKVTAR